MHRRLPEKTTENSATDSQYILLPPKQRLVIDNKLHKKLALALVTRYSPDDPRIKISVGTASKYIPASVRQWGQVQIRDGGDRFKCRALLKGRKRTRDCTYVKVRLPDLPFLHCISPVNHKTHKYEAEVDFYERRINMEPVMMKKTFFAELHRIIRLKLPASEDLHLDEGEEIFLALVKTCKAEQDEYEYWKYSSLGGFEFVDLATVECMCHCADSTRQFYSIYRPTRQYLLSNPLSTSSRLSRQSRNTRRTHPFLGHTTNAYD